MTAYKPFVSVIVPAYNRQALIEKTVQSILDQTYQNWEAIIVDDGSTDATYNIVENLCHSEERIKLYKRDRFPKGAPACRNIGLEKAKGEFIIFLDSDDLMAETCLERRVAFFEKYPDEDFLVFQSLLFTNEIDDLNILWNVNTNKNDLERFLRTDALWPICGPIYKKKALLKINGFREDLPFYQDFDLHLRFIFLKYKYRKYLEMTPDCFIKRHFENSVSNSIPFTSDKKILQQRIEFYHSQLYFINKNKIILSRSEKYTVWSVLFYFSSQLLLEHKSKKGYTYSWFKTWKLLRFNLIPHLLSYMFVLLTYLQKRHKYFIKIKTIYLSLFKKYIADDKLIFNSSLFMRKLENDSERKSEIIF